MQTVALVIDANVLIKRLALRDLLQCSDDADFNSKYSVYTLPDVIKELRDDNARQYLTQLPYELHIIENLCDKALDQVQSFAKLTGDSKTLSRTDTHVIALGVQLAIERGESDLIRKEPKPLQEFKPKKFQEEYQKLENEDESDESDDSEEEEVALKQVQEDDGFTQVTEKKHGDRRRHIKPKEINKEVKLEKEQDQQENTTINTEHRTQEQLNQVDENVNVQQDQQDETKEPEESKQEEEEEDAESSGIDDEATGGEWITPDNLYKHLSAADALPLTPAQTQQEPQKPTTPQSVYFLTSDFSMQNVIIQLGFQLLSLDGRRITRVKRFKLLCRACQKLNLNIEKSFCDFCGSHTLIKVSVYLNQAGQMTYFKNPRRKPRLRGTIYAIPRPVGGRNNKDLILREDVLMNGELKYRMKQIDREKRIQQKQIEDTIQGNYWAGGAGYGAAVTNLLYENGAKGGKMTSQTGIKDIQIGYGRKNPNVAKKRTGNKK